MHQIILKRKKINIYADAEETVINRYNKFNKCLLLRSEVGSDPTSIYDRIADMSKVADNPDKLANSTHNLLQLFAFITDEINVEHNAFAVMVASIDGEDRNDISDEGLKRTLKELSDLGLTQKVLKKKLTKSVRDSVMN